MSTYKGYSDTWGNKATIKYIKDKQKQVMVRWKKTEFTERIEPVIEKSGLPVATFVKEAVDEKIARNFNITKEVCENVVKRWTKGKIDDPRADRDALEEIVACICFDGDLEQAHTQIDKWRQQAIKTTPHH